MIASARGADRARCIALMFTSASPSIEPDPAHRPGPVVVAGHQHRRGRGPCRASSRRAGRAAARRRRPSRRPSSSARPTSPDSVSREAYWPASGVLRSMTVIPRARASAPALTRLTRSVVAVSRRPRRTAAVSGAASKAASSPATSRVRVVTPVRAELGEEPAEHLGQRQVRGDGAGRLRRQERGVDGVACGPAGEHVEDLGRRPPRRRGPGPRRSTPRGAGSGPCSGRPAAASPSAARARRRRCRPRRGGPP